MVNNNNNNYVGEPTDALHVHPAVPRGQLQHGPSRGGQGLLHPHVQSGRIILDTLNSTLITY